MTSSTATDDDILALLDADALAALMRATWTWDDRALRRELSALLVAVAAARLLAIDHDTARAGARTAVLNRIRTRSADFCSAVLGPRLLGELEDPRYRPYAALALGLTGADITDDRSVFAATGRDARSRYADVRGPAPRAQVSTRMLAAPLLAGLSPDDAAATLLGADAIVRGRATVAIAERGGSWDPASIRTRARRDHDGGWRLSGAKSIVPDLGAAELVLVVARTTAGPTVFAVDARAEGVVRRDIAGVDGSRTFGELVLDDVVAHPLGRDGAGGVLIGRLLDHATVTLAGDQLDTARAALAAAIDADTDTLDLATFGALHLDVVAAGGLADRAAELLGRGSAPWRAASGGPEAVAAATAHIACGNVAVRAARFAWQVHPGRGDVEVLLRRAVADQVLFGGPAIAHERLLDRLGV